MSETRLGTQHYCCGDDCQVCADGGGPRSTRHITPPAPALPVERADEEGAGVTGFHHHTFDEDGYCDECGFIEAPPVPGSSDRTEG